MTQNKLFIFCLLLFFVGDIGFVEAMGPKVFNRESVVEQNGTDRNARGSLRRFEQRELESSDEEASRSDTSVTNQKDYSKESHKDPLKGKISKLSLKKPSFFSDAESESSSSNSDYTDSSDASPDSSDSEYGAKTLMRKIRDYVHDIEEKAYAINQDGTEEVTLEEIKKNPSRYYIANFSGEYLDGFKKNLERRKVIAANVNGTIQEAAPAFESLAIRSLKKRMEQKYAKNPKKAAVAVTQEFGKFQTPKKLKESGYLSRYISTAGYHNAVIEVSPDDGSPFISTSKGVKVPVEYADHPKKEDARSVAASFSGAKSSLHPKYSEQGKPKHRLIGFVAVIVHEANDYLARTKADIEKLRRAGKVSGKSSRQKNDQEIIFEKTIESANIAGYIPLAYPNLSKLKKYSNEDKKLFGLEAEGRRPKAEKESPRSLSPHIKEYSIYRLNQILQWKLAEKYVKNKNPEGELLWVDKDGKLNRFRVNQLLEKEAEKEVKEKERVVRNLKEEFEEPVTVSKNSKEQSFQDRTFPTTQEESNAPLVETQMDRIKNLKACYDDGDMKDLGEYLLPEDTHYIPPAIAKVPEELGQSIEDFIQDKTKQHAVIAIHADHHFMGVCLHRTIGDQGNSFSIVYFDPSISQSKKEPLHQIPEEIEAVLNEKFPNVEIVATGSEIQTYTTQGKGSFKVRVLDNVHCGPFVLCIMTEMANGNVRLDPNGTRRLQIKFGDDNWNNLPALTKKESSDLGEVLREYHADILSENGELGDDRQINILRNLIKNSGNENEQLQNSEKIDSQSPLETMPALREALPEVTS